MSNCKMKNTPDTAKGLVFFYRDLNFFAFFKTVKHIPQNHKLYSVCVFNKMSMFDCLSIKAKDCSVSEL